MFCCFSTAEICSFNFVILGSVLQTRGLSSPSAAAGKHIHGFQQDEHMPQPPQPPQPKTPETQPKTPKPNPRPRIPAQDPETQPKTPKPNPRPRNPVQVPENPIQDPKNPTQKHQNGHHSGRESAKSRETLGIQSPTPQDAS